MKNMFLLLIALLTPFVFADDLEVTFPALPATDVAGSPARAISWSIYINDQEAARLIAVSEPIHTFNDIAYGEYRVQVSLTNELGEGELSPITAVSHTQPLGLPSQPGAPTVRIMMVSGVSSSGQDPAPVVGGDPYDLSPYSASLAELGLTAVWPIAPTGTLTPVTVTPATLAANNVNGRSLTLSAGDYGNVTISNTDQEWILQPGALINTLTIGASSQRIVVKGETPRVGRIGNFASVGGNTDLLVDGVYQIQGLYSGTYEVQNGFGGTRVAVVNSSLNSHGYAVRAYPDTDGRLYNFILAGNYIRQDEIYPCKPNWGALMRVSA